MTIPIEQVRAGQVVALAGAGVDLARFDVHAMWAAGDSGRVLLSDAAGITVSAPAGTPVEVLDVDQADVGPNRHVVLHDGTGS